MAAALGEREREREMWCQRGEGACLCSDDRRGCLWWRSASDFVVVLGVCGERERWLGAAGVRCPVDGGEGGSESLARFSLRDGFALAGFGGCGGASAVCVPPRPSVRACASVPMWGDRRPMRSALWPPACRFRVLHSCCRVVIFHFRSIPPVNLFPGVCLRLRGGAMPSVVGVVVSADEDAPDVL